MSKIRIQTTDASHIEGLMRVVHETGLFPGDTLPEMLSAHLQGNPDERWLTCLLEGVAIGLCYARAEEFTDGTWNMLALAVLPEYQGNGIGADLVSALESGLVAEGVRILLVDTSGTDTFARTRAFYQNNGYEVEARIRDFWADGDDKITFRKRLK
jgi:ribosomal protein S18 acetylase RimI-like enzyme